MVDACEIFVGKLLLRDRDPPERGEFLCIVPQKSSLIYAGKLRKTTCRSTLCGPRMW